MNMQIIVKLIKIISQACLICLTFSCGESGDNVDSSTTDSPNVSLNTPPQIEKTSNFSLLEHSDFYFTPSASDPDNDKLTFTIENIPNWATFNTTDGSLSGTPTSDDSGVYENIKITVTDGQDNAFIEFSIEIIDTVSIQGALISDYNISATIFMDLNANQHIDSNEPQTRSDSNGEYKLIINASLFERFYSTPIRAYINNEVQHQNSNEFYNSHPFAMSVLPKHTNSLEIDNVSEVHLSAFTHLIYEGLTDYVKRTITDEISVTTLQSKLQSNYSLLAEYYGVSVEYLSGNYLQILPTVSKPTQTMLISRAEKILLDAAILQSRELDLDLDGILNYQDEDADGDFIINVADAFPIDINESKDVDNDGIGDNADNDDDNDGVLDSEDDYPFDPSRYSFQDADNDGWPRDQDIDDENALVPGVDFIDTDGDGFANEGGLIDDLDDDNDGVSDIEDSFPLDPKESQDTDLDGVGNNSDLDDDGDLVPDTLDDFPLDASETKDTDNDGIGDNADLDDDGDGILDIYETGPGQPTELKFANETAKTGLHHSWDVELLKSNDVTHYQKDLLTAAGAIVSGDYDNDGDFDIFVATGDLSASKLFQNQGNNTYINVAKAAGVELEGELLSGASFADTDGDGDLDLFIGSLHAKNYLFENQGDGTFVGQIQEVTTNATVSSAFGDYDKDGDLDLLLSHWAERGMPTEDAENLWENTGNNTFVSVNQKTNVSSAITNSAISPDFSFTPAFADINNDLYPDLLMASDYNTSVVLLNNKDGTFSNHTSSLNIKIPDLNGMGSAIADYDNDGDLDWFVSGIFSTSFTGNKLFKNDGQGGFEDVSFASKTFDAGWAWGTCFADFNNDSHLDLFVTNGYHSDGVGGNGSEPHTTDSVKLFMSNGNGGFEETSVDAGLTDQGQGRGVLCYDANDDGMIDIFILNLDRNKNAIVYYENKNEELLGNYLKITLRSKTTNQYAIGAMVKLTSSGVTQMREVNINSNFISHNPTELHFGLGDSNSVDSLEIIWPDGQIEMMSSLDVNQTIIIEQ
ncbi:FG-GAP-like repeat-containing protein [Thalassomonas sp. M1454]|uniref:FG-GAP-like repeat-containing protein n=1 Tax=Thalassomonas sp. M1454 TaxID=2594477 RepID=UPI00117F7CA3|nr:FG-GAP-like repeat-containing protein [Thalassomonas sp. M1454]TRX54457.1 hypothetical protein FNN08_12050 [Thalassomonas sp. M1454]